jgi:aldehyde dehydrogenase (NAD+)
VGRRIAAGAAQTIKRVTLELGGKSANIIFDDADLEQAVRGAVAGIFGAAGQTCMAGSRLLVQRTVHDELVRRVVQLAGDAVVGDPALPQTQVGPIATAPQFRRILQCIDMAKAEGARCVLGGHALQGPGYGQGQFVAPTVFTGVDNGMRIAQEEVFGPVLCVIPFDDEADAIRIANASSFGLAAGVWTRDLHRALSVSDALQAGTVWVNNYRATSFTTPFGGYKRSGLGREGGVDAIREYLQAKSVWITTRPQRDNAFVLG